MSYLDINLAVNYKSSSQKIRVMTEFWTGKNIFCPNCGGNINHYDNNKPVADFFCIKCREDYELKSGKNLGNKIVDGAYSTMIARLKSNTNPNFFFLNYSDNYQIKNFIIIPKHYFIEDIIEKRKPLSETSRRFGWVGCNIMLASIPESGKIFYIKNGKYRDKHDILSDWSKTLFLKDQKNDSKGWTLDIIKCIESLNKKDFILQDIYNFEFILKQKYPTNNLY